MSICKIYCNSVREHLRKHPVWEPGDDIQIGDFGITRDGYFRKHGNINDYLSVQSHTTSSKNYIFKSSSVELNELRVDEKKKSILEIKFNKIGGMFVSTRSAEDYQIDNLQEVMDMCVIQPFWSSELQLVFSVKRIEAAILLVSAQDGALVSCSANASTLKKLTDGMLDDEALDAINLNMSSGSAAIYQRKKLNGPFLMGLVRGRKKVFDSGARLVHGAFPDRHSDDDGTEIERYEEIPSDEFLV